MRRRVLTIVIVFISLTICVHIMLKIFAPIFMSHYWKSNTCLKYQKENVFVYTSRLYNDDELEGIQETIDSVLVFLKKANLTITHRIDLIFFRNLSESVKYHSISSDLYGGVNIGYACSFISYDFSKKQNISIIIHELVHSYEYDKYGRSKDEKWKSEGFAEFHSNPFYPDIYEFNDKFLQSIEDDTDIGFFYFLGRLRTDYLLRHKGIPEDEYWDTKYDTDKLDDEIREALQSGEYRAFEQ